MDVGRCAEENVEPGNENLGEAVGVGKEHRRCG